MSDITFVESPIVELAEAPAANDLFPIWDASASQQKYITAQNAGMGIISGGGSIVLGGFALTVPKTGTVPIGTGAAGRVAEWTGTNDIAASTLAKSGVGVLTLASSGTFTLTVPKTGTVPVGTGTAGRVAEWVTDTNTIQASTLAKSGVGILTLASSGTFTLTVPASLTVAGRDVTNTFSQLQTFSAGLTFGGNTLSNYTEGTWSPTITGSGSNPTISYTSQTGVYTRIGNTVFFSIGIAISTISGGSGDIRISLPFTPNATQICALQTTNVDLTTPASIAFVPQTAGAYGRIQTTQDNADRVVEQISALANGDSVQASGFFFVA